MGAEATAPLPGTITVCGRREDLERSFAAVAPLQPVEWSAAGLICTPRAAPELATSAMARCPFPVQEEAAVSAWPRTEARMLGRWYVRGVDHVAGPVAVAELLQVPGDGFGPGGHATTEMSLAAIAHMPVAPALDAGCGSGLLSQAWVRAKRRPVLACDPDHAAIRQACASLHAARLTDRVELRQAMIETLGTEDLRGRVILANLPAPGHVALLDRLTAPPPGVVASGIHGDRAHVVRKLYQDLGMRVVSAARHGRWRCFGLVAA